MPKRLEISKGDAKKLRRRLKIEDAQRLDFHGFGGDVNGLRAFLAHKYGGAVRGWRIAMAPDREGVAPATFSQFCRGLKHIGYSGQAMSLWRQLSKNSGTFAGIEDLEPDLAEQLDSLCKAFTDCFTEGVPEAWEELRREHMCRATFDELEEFLQEKKISRKCKQVNLRRVFDVLDVAHRGTISKQDLRFLDHWAQRRLGIPVPDEPSYSHIEPEPWSPPPCEKDPDPGLDDFRAFLENKFGSAALAWRLVLDVRGQGKITAREFGKCCRSMGWHHPHYTTWRELCDAGGGFASMRSLDPDTANSIDNYNAAVVKQYGDTSAFWTAVLDPTRTDAVSKKHFIMESSKVLNMSIKEVERVFRVLDCPGSELISESEMDFLHDPQILASKLCEEGADTSHVESAGNLSVDRWLLKNEANSGSLPVRQGLPIPPKAHRSPLWSPETSTRSTQYRNYANCHSFKHQVLRHTALDRHQLSINKPTRPKTNPARASAQSDVFRTTNDFYRQSVRLLLGAESEDSEDSEGEDEDGDT